MTARWYIVQAYSNFERKVAEAIRETAERTGLSDAFEEILVPSEEVVEIRRGQKVSAERKLIPGYVLVKMHMSDEAYHLVIGTQRVTGFLGPQGKPAPVSEAEVKRMTNQSEDSVERPKPTIMFSIGETVNVIDGPFEGFSGVVEDVDVETSRLKVAVSIFGRATPVELEYGQVQKTA